MESFSYSLFYDSIYTHTNPVKYKWKTKNNIKDCPSAAKSVPRSRTVPQGAKTDNKSKIRREECCRVYTHGLIVELAGEEQVPRTCSEKESIRRGAGPPKRTREQRVPERCKSLGETLCVYTTICVLMICAFSTVIGVLIWGVYYYNVSS